MYDSRLAGLYTFHEPLLYTLACFKATVTILWRVYVRMIICSILILIGAGVTVQSQCELQGYS